MASAATVCCLVDWLVGWSGFFVSKVPFLFLCFPRDRHIRKHIRTYEHTHIHTYTYIHTLEYHAHTYHACMFSYSLFGCGACEIRHGVSE